MTNRIIIFLCILLMGLGNRVHAQDPAGSFWIGGRGGISIPNLTAGGSNNNPVNTGYGSRLGPDFGIYAEQRLSRLFSLMAMLEYSSQGGKKNGMQAFTTPDQYASQFPPGQVPPYLYANYKSEAKMNYLMLPVLGKFGWDLGMHGTWRLYVDAGPFAAYLLNAKQVTSGTSEIYLDPSGQKPVSPGPVSFDSTQSITSDLHRFNFGVEGNVGLAYRFGRNCLFIEGGGNYGFLNIQKGTVNGKNNTGAATVVVGYAFRCNKK